MCAVQRTVISSMVMSSEYIFHHNFEKIFNLFEKWGFDNKLHIFVHDPYSSINISSRFSSNSEANASELLENFEEI